VVGGGGGCEHVQWWMVEWCAAMRRAVLPLVDWWPWEVKGFAAAETNHKPDPIQPQAKPARATGAHLREVEQGEPLLVDGGVPPDRDALAPLLLTDGPVVVGFRLAEGGEHTLRYVREGQFGRE